jgi:hypothetical protein
VPWWQKKGGNTMKHKFYAINAILKNNNDSRRAK